MRAVHTVCKDYVGDGQERSVKGVVYGRIDMPIARTLNRDRNHGDHDRGEDTDEGCLGQRIASLHHADETYTRSKTKTLSSGCAAR